MGKKQQLENDFYKESAVKLTGDISAKKKGGRGRSEDRGITYSKCTMAKKKNPVHPQFYIHQNYLVKNEGEIKSFPDQQKLREYINSHLPYKNH